MKHFRYVLSQIWLWFAIILGCFFIENVALLSNGNPMDGFNDFSFYSLFGIITILLFVYYLLEHKRNNANCNWILLAFFVCIFAVNTWSIWRNPTNFLIPSNDPESTDFTMVISNDLKIRSTIQLGITLIMLYTIIYPFGKSRVRNAKMIWLNYIYALVVVVSIVYTFFCSDIDVYKTLFLESPDHSIRGIKSFYISPNTLGLAFLVGIISLMTANFYKKGWYNYLLIFVFYIFLIATKSATSIFIASLSIVIYIAFKLIRKIVMQPISGTILLVITLVIIGGLVCLYYVGSYHKWPICNNFSKLLKELFDSKNNSTFTGRVPIWRATIGLVQESPLSLLFGYGYGTGNAIYREYAKSIMHWSIRSCHNGYLEVFLIGGLFGILCYGIGLIYFLYCIVRLISLKKVRFALLYLLAFVAMCAHDYIESTRFFDISTSGMVVMMTIYLPVINAYRNIKNRKLVQEAATNNVWQHNIDISKLTKVISMIIISLIITVSLIFITPNAYNNPMMRKVLLLIDIFLGCSVLFLPYFISLIYCRSSDKRATLRYIFGSIVILGGSVGLFFLFKYATKDLFLSLIYSFLSYAGIGVLFTTIYSKALKGSVKCWFFDTLKGMITVPNFAILFEIIIGSILFIALPYIVLLDNLSIIIVSIINLLVFYLTFRLLPFKYRKELTESFNNESLYKWKKIVYKSNV